MAAAPVYYGTIANDLVQLLNADGADTYVTLYTAPASGSEVLSIMVSSTEVAASDVTLALTKGGVDYPLVTRSIVAGAGTTSSLAAVDMLDETYVPWIHVDANGNGVISMETGSVLKVKILTTAVEATKAINFFVQSREI